MAQLVARYLGVVEAASSSLVTQTKQGSYDTVPVFCLFMFTFVVFYDIIKKISCIGDIYEKVN